MFAAIVVQARLAVAKGGGMVKEVRKCERGGIMAATNRSVGRVR